MENQKNLDMIREVIVCSNILSKVIKNYLINKNHNCNVTQIFILHFLFNIDRKSTMTGIEMKMRDVSINNTYNIQCLIKNGYLIKESGVSLKADGRCEFITITEKGKQLYNDICAYTTSKIDKLIEKKIWTDKKQDLFLKIIEDLRHIGK